MEGFAIGTCNALAVLTGARAHGRTARNATATREPAHADLRVVDVGVLVGDDGARPTPGGHVSKGQRTTSDGGSSRKRLTTAATTTATATTTTRRRRTRGRRSPRSQPDHRDGRLWCRGDRRRARVHARTKQRRSRCPPATRNGNPRVWTELPAWWRDLGRIVRPSTGPSRARDPTRVGSLGFGGTLATATSRTAALVTRVGLAV